MIAHRPERMVRRNVESQAGTRSTPGSEVVIIEYILNVWEVCQQKASHDPPVQRQYFLTRLVATRFHRK
jgi:hypothetical protein